jgi:hypothetical protein
MLSTEITHWLVPSGELPFQIGQSKNAGRMPALPVQRFRDTRPFSKATARRSKIAEPSQS